MQSMRISSSLAASQFWLSPPTDYSSTSNFCALNWKLSRNSTKTCCHKNCQTPNQCKKGCRWLWGTWIQTQLVGYSTHFIEQTLSCDRISCAAIKLSPKYNSVLKWLCRSMRFVQQWLPHWSSRTVGIRMHKLKIWVTAWLADAIFMKKWNPIAKFSITEYVVTIFYGV